MSLDSKYRPKHVKDCIGHTAAVTQLLGALKTGDIPKALLFTGPTSVGKTTLGRAFTADLNGLDQNDFPHDLQEIDGASTRTKDEILNVIRMSRFQPQVGKRRVILLDEAQGVLSNHHAAATLLKELEEPAPRTLWILCSMDPGMFATDKNGKAIANRCRHFSLAQHTNEDLYKQGVRIVKGEKFNFITPDVLKRVVRESRFEMRTLAHSIAALASFHAGLAKPRTLTEADVVTAAKLATASTEGLVVRFLAALYAGKFVEAQKAILDAEDYFQFVNQALWGAKFMMNVTVLGGAKHGKVWWNPANRELHNQCKSIKPAPTLGDYAAVVTMLVRVRSMVAHGNLEDTLTAAVIDYLMSSK